VTGILQSVLRARGPARRGRPVAPSVRPLPAPVSGVGRSAVLTCQTCGSSVTVSLAADAGAPVAGFLAGHAHAQLLADRHTG
jgi:hypothetical protein